MGKIFEYNHVKSIRVIDGDSFEAVIDLGYGVSISQKFRVRDFDCCEKTRRMRKGIKASQKEKEKGIEALNYAKAILTPESISCISVYNKKDLYGRYLCDIAIYGETYKSTPGYIQEHDYADQMKYFGYSRYDENGKLKYP